MDNPLCRGLYAAWSCSKVWLKQNLFIRKILIAAIISFIQHYFVDCSNFYFQLRWKYKSNKHLIQLFIFIFASKPSSVSLQSYPQDTLCTSFWGKWRIQPLRLKFSQKMDIDLEFQKTNLRIRISMLEILCLFGCVCVLIFKQNK